VVQDILSHVFNAAEWLVSPIDRLMADAAHLRLPKVQVEDTVHVVARHGSILANYTVNQHQHVAEFTLDVHGTEGAFGRISPPIAGPRLPCQTANGRCRPFRLLNGSRNGIGAPSST